jgi:acyl-CoA thioesterase FadM
MNLYLRLLWTWLRALRKPRIQFGDAIELQLRVWPNDLDVNGHMNNGRYMTISDLALIEYFTRAGLLREAVRRGWRPMLGGSLISFRRGLKPFKRYTLRFAVSCWDERWSYLRFEFVHDGRTMALGHAKGAVVGRDGFVGSGEILAAIGVDRVSPAMPEGVAAWVAAERALCV